MNQQFLVFPTLELFGTRARVPSVNGVLTYSYLRRSMKHGNQRQVGRTWRHIGGYGIPRERSNLI
jgi:hypothetical protein